jgi:hypothetical protein
MSAQVLSQTKGVLLAVDDCTGKLLIVYRPVVQALKDFSNQSNISLDGCLTSAYIVSRILDCRERTGRLAVHALGPEI